MSLDLSTQPSAVPSPHRSKRTLIRLIQFAVSGVVVVGIFALILPKIASYSDVWHTVTSLTWLELVTLFAAAVFNLFTYWWQMVAAMPGLSTWQAAVNNQSSTTIANAIPGGGVVSLGVAVAMFRSWGFTGSEIALLISTTGIWNSFMKLGLPIAALGALALSGQATSALLLPALVGLAILAAAILLFGLALWRREFARAIGTKLGAAYSSLRKLVRRPPVTTWGEGAVRFRRDTIALVSKRWMPLTLTTVVSHLGLWFVLLLALRHMGVAEHDVSTIQVLAVFAFARLLSAAPITPGGVGFVELALIGGLYAAGRHHADVPLDVFRTQITAAVLLFRTLTYLIQVPLGGVTYVIWRSNKSWRRPQPALDLEPMAPVPELTV